MLVTIDLKEEKRGPILHWYEVILKLEFNGQNYDLDSKEFLSKVPVTKSDCIDWAQEKLSVLIDNNLDLVACLTHMNWQQRAYFSNLAEFPYTVEFGNGSRFIFSTPEQVLDCLETFAVNCVFFPARVHKYGVILLDTVLRN